MKISGTNLIKIVESDKLGNRIKDLWMLLVAVALAFAVGAVIIAVTGESPIGAYEALVKGAFGSVYALSNTISKSVPLIFTGLAVALAFRSGLLNLGVEGQLYIGAITSTVIALTLPEMPRVIVLPLVIGGGSIAAMLWASIAGFLKAKFGTSEVIVSIMTNYIAILFTSYLVNGPIKAEGWVAQTEVLPETAFLARIIPKTQLSTSIVIALLVSFLVYVFLWKTTWGFELRTVGENPFAAKTGGINVMKSTLLAMALSGGIAGLAGISEVLGTYHRFIDGFSPGFGFTGIAVAVLGKNHPVGVILTALLFGALDTGALQLDRTTSISGDIVIIIQGLVIVFVAAPEIAKFLIRRRRKEI